MHASHELIASTAATDTFGWAVPRNHKQWSSYTPHFSGARPVVSVGSAPVGPSRLFPHPEHPDDALLVIDLNSGRHDREVTTRARARLPSSRPCGARCCRPDVGAKKNGVQDPETSAASQSAQQVRTTTAQSINGYDAYFGTYTINVRLHKVTHHLEGALVSSDIGKNFTGASGLPAIS